MAKKQNSIQDLEKENQGRALDLFINMFKLPASVFENTGKELADNGKISGEYEPQIKQAKIGLDIGHAITYLILPKGEDEAVLSNWRSAIEKGVSDITLDQVENILLDIQPIKEGYHRFIEQAFALEQENTEMITNNDTLKNIQKGLEDLTGNLYDNITLLNEEAEAKKEERINIETQNKKLKKLKKEVANIRSESRNYIDNKLLSISASFEDTKGYKGHIDSLGKRLGELEKKPGNNSDYDALKKEVEGLKQSIAKKDDAESVDDKIKAIGEEQKSVGQDMKIAIMKEVEAKLNAYELPKAYLTEVRQGIEAYIKSNTHIDTDAIAQEVKGIVIETAGKEFHEQIVKQMKGLEQKYDQQFTGYEERLKVLDEFETSVNDVQGQYNQILADLEGALKEGYVKTSELGDYMRKEDMEEFITRQQVEEMPEISSKINLNGARLMAKLGTIITGERKDYFTPDDLPEGYQDLVEDMNAILNLREFISE